MTTASFIYIWIIRFALLNCLWLLGTLLGEIVMGWAPATLAGKRALRDIVKSLSQEKNISPLVPDADDQVEVAERKTEENSYLFLLNHQSKEGKSQLYHTYRDVLTEEVFSGSCSIPGHGVRILRKEL